MKLHKTIKKKGLRTKHHGKVILTMYTNHFLRKADLTASLHRGALKMRSLWRLTLETYLYHPRMNYSPAI